MGSPSLRQLAYVQIHEAIVKGAFPKGTVTSEGELCRMLDMSRTPIRAALQQLELEGYVRIASKHGIIILDSSAQRVGDLLELVVSLVFFSHSVSSVSKREQLLGLASRSAEDFRELIPAPQEDPKAVADFELELLRSLVSLCNNEEMKKTFQSATTRLFWHQNGRRWQAPFIGESKACVGKLIGSLTGDPESFREALFGYLSLLKRTWL